MRGPERDSFPEATAAAAADDVAREYPRGVPAKKRGHVTSVPEEDTPLSGSRVKLSLFEAQPDVKRTPRYIRSIRK